MASPSPIATNRFITSMLPRFIATCMGTPACWKATSRSWRDILPRDSARSGYGLTCASDTTDSRERGARWTDHHILTREQPFRSDLGMQQRQGREPKVHLVINHELQHL